MPHRLDTHVLTVDPNVIHKVDTANLAHLSSIWTVFSRCADSVDQGRRLENLSWRLWQREQLVENEAKAPATALTTSPNTVALPQNIRNDRLSEVPQLSGSVESAADDEAVEFTSVSAPLDISRPRILRQDSSSRRDRHISSDDFEKMIMSIVKDKAPLSAPTSSSQQLCKPAHKTPSIQRSGSTTTESQSPSKESDMPSEPESHPSPEMPSRTNVVRGFSPSQIRIPTTHSLQPGPSGPIPEPTSEPAAKLVQSKKLPTTFKLGASCSSSEQGASVESRQPVPTKKTGFQIGVSSEEEGSLRSAIHSRRSGLSAQKKQASFSNNVSTRTIEHADTAIDSDSEDYVDESAIDDDDDSSDWEDSLEDNSGKSSVDDKFFQRVDSTANLTSRRSLITLALAQNDRSQSTSALRARSTPNGPSIRGSPKSGSPNDSDEAPLMMKGMRSSNLKPIREVPRTGAQPIQAAPTYVHAQVAQSPRTNRRNMLATELPDSLRRGILWERQQKSMTANAVKRRHTSTDLVNLRQHPDKACIKNEEDEDAQRWTQYFAKEQFDGYHSKGW